MVRIWVVLQNTVYKNIILLYEAQEAQTHHVQMAAGRDLSETAWLADVKVYWKREKERSVSSFMLHLTTVTDILGKVQLEST